MTTQKSNKGHFIGVITANKQIGCEFYRLGLQLEGTGAKAFAKLKPGQFAQLDLSNTPLPPADKIPEHLADTAQRNIILRRPFSFCDITIKSNKVLAEILYCVVGPASLRMTTLSKGDTINIIGPLGNGFSVPKNKKTALLVIGGMGAGPLLHLAKTLKGNNPKIKTIAFVGAKTECYLPFKVKKTSRKLKFTLEDFAKEKIKTLVTTDDGSLGIKGFVTDCLKDWLNCQRPSATDTIIYGCGPEAMLAETAEIGQKYNIDCQISMERIMACGFGVCQSCAVECKDSVTGGTFYKMCCKDGPVFESKEVVFER